MRVDVSHIGRRLVDRSIDETAQGIAFDSLSPWIRAAALCILRSGPERPEPYDTPAQIGALFRWVRDRLYYVADPYPAEYLQTAAYTIRAGGGDCDCLVRALGALLLSVGIPVRLVVTSHHGEGDRSEPSHIWLEAHDGSTWVALDPTRRELEPGDSPPRIARRWTGGEILAGARYTPPPSPRSPQCRVR